MIDDTPDYASYSLAQLRDVQQRVNCEKFPDRHAQILAQIERREKDGFGEKEEKQDQRKSHRAKVQWGSWGMLVFAAFIFLNGFFEPVVSTLASRR